MLLGNANKQTQNGGRYAYGDDHAPCQGGLHFRNICYGRQMLLIVFQLGNSLALTNQRGSFECAGYFPIPFNR